MTPLFTILAALAALQSASPASMTVCQPGALFMTDAKNTLALGARVELVPDVPKDAPAKPKSPKGNWWLVRASNDVLGWVRKGDLVPVEGANTEIVSAILNKVKDKPVKAPRYWAEVMDFAERAILDTPADIPVAPLQVVRMQAFVKALEYGGEQREAKAPPKPDAIPDAWWGPRANLFYQNDYSGQKMLNDAVVVELERPLRGTEEGEALMWVAARLSCGGDCDTGLMYSGVMRYVQAYPAGEHVNEVLAAAQKACDQGEAGGRDPSSQEVQNDLRAAAAALQGVAAEKFPTVTALRQCIANYK